MSRQDVEVVRGIIEAAARGDAEAALDGYDEDAILDQTRMPDGGMYYGRKAVGTFYSRWFGSWDDLSIQLERVFEAGDRVVAVIALSARGAGSGAPVRMRVADVCTVADGKVVHQVGYTDASEALDAVGLTE